MEAPKVIYAGQDESDGYAYWFNTPQEPHHNCPKYIRADLVDKLIGYAMHDDGSKRIVYTHPEDRDCTCGLTKLIAEIRGE